MYSREALDSLRDSAPTIMPSLLMCNFGDLRREVQQLEAAGVRGLHLDVMDGHFVPNLTYGMPIVRAINELTDLPLDVHLMTSNPEAFVGEFVRAGADLVTFHVETVAKPRDVIDQIHEHGAAAGLALNPDTPWSVVEPDLEACDLVLVMSVNAGFGGQSFQPVALEKLRQFRSVNSDIVLQVDGGVNPDTVADCRDAGAELLVVGSAIFGHADYGEAIDRLRSLALKG